MNRELKFRAWDRYLNKMICTGFNIIGEVTVFSGLEIMIQETPIPNVSSLDRLFNMAITQFTGRTNKKGVDIYEGDIIHCCNQNCVVVFGSVTCGFGYHVKLLKWGKIVDKFYRLTSKDEPIGNIYENPNLMA